MASRRTVSLKKSGDSSLASSSERGAAAADDDDDNNEDNREFLPLVAKASPRTSLEIEGGSSNHIESSTLVESFKLIGALLLASAMVMPWLLFHRPGPHKTYDGSSCSGLDSVPDLMQRVIKTEDYCDGFQTFAGRNCTCKNPIIASKPTEPADYRSSWNYAFKRNLDIVKNAQEDLDLILLGDSITEHWLGTSLGSPSEKYTDVSVVFKELFTHEGGSSLESMALGISGDRCPNVLYRISHGELPTSLNPKVIWLLIGTNDLGSDFCSVDSVVAGNMQILQELRYRFPDCKIVVNSILPRHPSPLLDEPIAKINAYLDCLIRGMHQVEFYYANDIFLMEDDDSKKPTIDHIMMPDYLHPSAEGARLWGTAIKNKVQELISS